MTNSELPRATIVRIAKDETDLRISEEAKEYLIESTEDFIRNVARESSSHDFFEDRRTIQERDIRRILNDKRYKRLIPEVENDG